MAQQEYKQETGLTYSHPHDHTHDHPYDHTHDHTQSQEYNLKKDLIYICGVVKSYEYCKPSDKHSLEDFYMSLMLFDTFLKSNVCEGLINIDQILRYLSLIFVHTRRIVSYNGYVHPSLDKIQIRSSTQYEMIHLQRNMYYFVNKLCSAISLL